MALNPSIILQGSQRRGPSLMEVAGQALQMKRAMDASDREQKLAPLQEQKILAETEAANALKGQRTSETALKQAEARTQALALTLGSAENQQMWSYGLQRLSESGLFQPEQLQAMPQEFTPELRDTLRAIGPRAHEYAQEMISQATLAETQRHNQATEQQARETANRPPTPSSEMQDILAAFKGYAAENGIPANEANYYKFRREVWPNMQRQPKLLTPEEEAQEIRIKGATTKPDKERLVQVMGPQGTPIWVRESDAEGKPAAQAPRAVTGQERQALAFYNRAQQAIDDISAKDKSDTSLESKMADLWLHDQLRLKADANIIQSKEMQAYRQAQRAFTEARLRKESGAAIPTAEYENDAKTYFAQPGDKPETIAQKAKARQVVLDGLRFGAGKAYDEYYGESAGPQRPKSDPLGLF